MSRTVCAESFAMAWEPSDKTAGSESQSANMLAPCVSVSASERTLIPSPSKSSAVTVYWYRLPLSAPLGSNQRAACRVFAPMSSAIRAIPLSLVVSLNDTRSRMDSPAS